MAYPREESAKFAQAASELLGKFENGRDKALAEAAGRGFPLAPGGTLTAILFAGQDVKGKLTEVNGKIYDDRRKVLFEQDEFAMKVIVQLAKLGMELYREELMNALVLEAAEKDALRDRGNADVIAMNAEVDKRQVAIIRARAEMEQRITALKANLVAAEANTLIYETALIDAQIATATKKLEIIDSLYQILAAEELVLAAENRRAETLTALLAAENVVAAVKRAMIPLYIEKAEAKVKLADAIIDEIPVRKAIEELGFDRITLENRKEFAAHLLRLAENKLELARSGWTRANSVLTLAQAKSRRLLQEHETATQKTVLALKKSLTEDGIDLRLSTSLARTAIGVNDDVEIQAAETGNTGRELTAIVEGLASRAGSQARAIFSGKRTSTRTTSTQELTRLISGG